MSSVLRFGIVGCGGIVRKHHLRNLLRHPDRFHVAALCDVDEMSVRAASEASGAKPYGDFRGMMESEPLDAVLVATPHHAHAEPVLMAAERGLHVLLEKPMAITLDDCERMVAACSSAGVTFMVAENERYKPNFRSVGRAICGGLIGDVLAIRAEMYGRGDRANEPDHWLHDPERSGGGIVIALAIHRLDVMRWLGGPLRSVSAAFEAFEGKRPGIERIASVQLRFASGAVGHFLSAEVPAPPPKSGALLVMGTRGTIGVLMPGAGYNGPAVLFRPDDAAPTPLPLDRDGLASDDAFDAEILHFASCVESALEPHTSGRDNLETMRLVFAAYESARSGRVVELPSPLRRTKGPTV